MRLEKVGDGPADKGRAGRGSHAGDEATDDDSCLDRRRKVSSSAAVEKVQSARRTIFCP